MKSNIILLSATAMIALASCGSEGEKKEVAKNAEKIASPTAPAALEMLPTISGPEYPGATLTIKDLTAKAIEGSDSVEITVNYHVKNYELKTQTADAADRVCNNSKDGQHIHFILNNEPYVALYEPTHSFKAKKGSEHLLLSFLSRSYHLSLKNKEAHTLVKFKIDAQGKLVKEASPKEPMVFYSRPKGTYIGNDTKEVLLDFFLINADMEKDSLKIVANINGESKEITKWEPYVLKGLPMGGNKIQLNLLKSNGTNLENNSHASVSREFTLAESEPIKK